MKNYYSLFARLNIVKAKFCKHSNSQKRILILLTTLPPLTHPHTHASKTTQIIYTKLKRELETHSSALRDRAASSSAG